MLSLTFQVVLVSCLPRALDQIRELLFNKIFLKGVLHSVSYLGFVHKGSLLIQNYRFYHAE